MADRQTVRKREEMNRENVNPIERHGKLEPTKLLAVVKPQLPVAKPRSVMVDLQPNRVQEQRERPAGKPAASLRSDAAPAAPRGAAPFSSRLGIYDPDAATRDDPLAVTEYINDIYAYLRALELQFPIRRNHLADAATTPKMRCVLLDWLVEVHDSFQLCLETLHLAVSIIDRYLQRNAKVGRKELQLVGTTALMIAAKYEEVVLPNIDDYIYVAAGSFVRADIMRMEVDIIKQLDFSFSKPMAVHFLRRYSKVAKVRMDQHNLAKYILELALMEYGLQHVRPSVQAAAACCLAVCILTNVMQPSVVWTPTLEVYSHIKYKDFKGTLIAMADMLYNAEESKYQAIRKKYSEAKLEKISLNSSLRQFSKVFATLKITS